MKKLRIKEDDRRFVFVYYFADDEERKKDRVEKERNPQLSIFTQPHPIHDEIRQFTYLMLRPRFGSSARRNWEINRFRTRQLLEIF